MEDIVKTIRQKAKELLTDSRGSHDWDHTLRVYNSAVKMAAVLGADIYIVKVAALLHDIGRHQQDKSNGKDCHAIVGAQMAQDILSNYIMQDGIVEAVVHAIRAHRYREGYKPATLEAKVLYDADKLDAIGAIGIGRAFLFAGEIGAKLHNSEIDNIEHTAEYSQDDTAYREYMVKLRFIKDKMLTEEGRRLAKNRHDFMVNYFDALSKEAVGLG